jgi:glycosyltransferase involved in cell wall biosynthesis
MAQKKTRLLRVITQAEVVPWHLNNFIIRSENNYDLFIVGNDVSRYKHEYPYVTFIDIEISRKVSFCKDIVALFRLMIICIEIRPQIIHSIMPKAGLLSSLAGFLTFIPIRIHTFTGQVWATKTGIKRWMLIVVDKFILRCCTNCLTDSPSQSAFLAKNGLSESGKPIGNLGKGSLSGVDLKKFDVDLVKTRNERRIQLGIDENDFVFIFLARKSLVKGVKELFESFSKVTYLPNVKLLFIGPDESNGILSELFVKYEHISNKIISLDIVKDHENYLAVADVFCLPSSSEGFGTVVIEAAALGIPTIGFDIVGLSDAIEHNNTGILVPYKNVNMFSEAMIELYENEEKFSKMKVKARARVLDYFSADVVYKYQSEFYKLLLQS